MFPPNWDFDNAYYKNMVFIIIWYHGTEILETQYLYGIASLGRLGIVDHDVVELNNMHRQVQVRKCAPTIILILFDFTVVMYTIHGFHSNADW